MKTLLILLSLSGACLAAEPETAPENGVPELDFLEFLGEFAGTDGDIELPESDPQLWDPQALEEDSPEQRLKRLQSAEPLLIEPATPVEKTTPVQHHATQKVSS